MIPWTVACQAPLSMEFPMQEYWSRLPFVSPGELPGDPRIKLTSPSWQVNSLPLSYLGNPHYKVGYRKMGETCLLGSQTRTGFPHHNNTTETWGKVIICCWKRVFAMTVHSLGKPLLVFALLHSILQGQICLLL